MITKISFDTEIDIPCPSTKLLRKTLIRQHNVIKAQQLLKEKGAEKGRWEFIAKIVGILNNGKIIDDYTDEFSLTI